MYSAVSACWCRLRISQGVRWARCTTAGREDVDGTGCVVQYEHPLCSDRYSFVKSPADLNGALLLKRREAISSAIAHLRAGVPGGWKHFWVICRLRGLLVKRLHTLKDLHCPQRIILHRRTLVYHLAFALKAWKLLFLIWFYLQFAVRNGSDCLKYCIPWEV